MNTPTSTRWTPPRHPRCGKVWTLIQAAQLGHDLGLNAPPEEEVFDEFVLHVDGWLCEIKDAQFATGCTCWASRPKVRS